MIDVEGLETLSTMLGVKKKIVEADIRDMAWLWEKTISEAKFADPLLVFHVLNAVARSYLRGRNLRMGNYQGLQRHWWIDATLLIALVQYVCSDSSFDCLHRVGVSSVQSFASALNNHFEIIDEANRILQERSTDERE